MPRWHSCAIKFLQTWPSCGSLGLCRPVPREGQLRQSPLNQRGYSLGYCRGRGKSIGEGLHVLVGLVISRQALEMLRPAAQKDGHCSFYVVDSNHKEFALDDVCSVQGRAKDECRFVFRMDDESRSRPEEIDGFLRCSSPG